MAQDFTCTTLDMVRLKADEIWGSDDKFRSAIRPQVEVVKAIKEKSTAKTLLRDGDGCKEIKVWWYDPCGTTVADNDIECEFTGDDIKTSCKTYQFATEKMAKFTLDDAEFCNNDAEFETAIAQGLLKAATNLDNQIEKDVIAAVDAAAGTNQYTEDDRGDVVGTTTYIAPQYWGPGLMSYLSKVAITNYQENSFLISGENMYDVWYNSIRNNLNDNQKDQLAKLNAFDWSFDLFNMDSILGAKKTLMISPDAVLFESWNKFTDPAKGKSYHNGANIDRFTFPSPNVPGVVYDVVYRTVCKNGGDDIIHHWKLIARYDTFFAPVSECVVGNTGIIAFECGLAP